MMDEAMQLVAELSEREQALEELQQEFIELRNRFTELDYAFKTNLQIHQQREVELHELTMKNKELFKVGEERLKRCAWLDDRLTKIYNEKEASRKQSEHWKEALSEQRKLFELQRGNYRMEYKSAVAAARNEYKKILKEAQTIAEKHIGELTADWKADQEKANTIENKAKLLQESLDIFESRALEMVKLVETLPPIDENFRTISRHIVEVLQSFSMEHVIYEERMRAFSQQVFGQITRTEVKSAAVNVPDYEGLKNQNMVLREVVKKLKRDLNDSEKKSGKQQEVNLRNLRNELIQAQYENENLKKLISQRDSELMKFEKSNNEQGRKLELDLDLIKMRAENSKKIVSEINPEEDRRVFENKLVQTDQNYLEDLMRETLENFRSELQLSRKMSKCRTMLTDNIRIPVLNLDSNGSQSDSEMKIESDMQPEKNGSAKLLLMEQLEPFESFRYKEYVITFSKRREIKIRFAKGVFPNEDSFKVMLADSEEEYQSASLDKVVVYFKNIEIMAAMRSKTTNCGIQTVKTNASSDSTQTPPSGNLGQMLKSEKRAIERTVGDLEKTVSDLRWLAVNRARTMIGRNSTLFGNDEFFKCIQYLSR